jgi:hypothetical protein
MRQLCARKCQKVLAVAAAMQRAAAAVVCFTESRCTWLGCAFWMRPVALNSIQTQVELSFSCCTYVAHSKWQGRCGIAVSGMLACGLFAWCLYQAANGFERTTHGRGQSVVRGQQLPPLRMAAVSGCHSIYLHTGLVGVSAGHVAAAAIAIYAVWGQKASGMHLA